MIAVLAAAIVAQPAPQRLSTWSQMADELERTGAIVCPLDPHEERQSAETQKRLVAFPEFQMHAGPDGDFRQDNECAVMTVSIGKSGRVKTARVLRYKGRGNEGAAYFGMKVIRGVRFKPADRDWNGLLVFNFGFRPEEIPALVKVWRARGE